MNRTTYLTFHISQHLLPSHAYRGKRKALAQGFNFFHSGLLGRFSMTPLPFPERMNWRLRRSQKSRLRYSLAGTYCDFGRSCAQDGCRRVQVHALTPCAGGQQINKKKNSLTVLASSLDALANDGASGMVFFKPLGCIKWLLLLFDLILRLPVFLEPWALVLLLLLRRQKALVFNTSLLILDHGIRIHVSSLYWTCRVHSHFKDRYSPPESLRRTFVCQFTSLQTQRLMTSCRLITSSTTGYDGMSFRI